MADVLMVATGGEVTRLSQVEWNEKKNQKMCNPKLLESIHENRVNHSRPPIQLTLPQRHFLNATTAIITIIFYHYFNAILHLQK